LINKQTRGPQPTDCRTSPLRQPWHRHRTEIRTTFSDTAFAKNQFEGRAGLLVVFETSTCQTYPISILPGRDIGAARGGPKGPCPSKIIGKYSHFVFWEAFFQTK